MPITTSPYLYTSFHPRMCMVNPISRKVDSSTRGVVTITTIPTIRPTSRPSEANERPIAPISVPITKFQTLSHITTVTTIRRHSRHFLGFANSVKSRVCPGPSRPGTSRIHAIDVAAEPPAAFHAYGHLSLISTNEKDGFDKINRKDAIGEELADTYGKHGCNPSSHTLTYLPLPVTSKQSSKSTKNHESIARVRARLILTIALVILCIYNYSHYYGPLRQM